MPGHLRPPELSRRPPSNRDHHHPKRSQDDSHSGVGYVLGILNAGFEFEPSIISREQTCQTNQHLSERWVDIKVEVAIDVVGAELAEMCLAEAN